MAKKILKCLSIFLRSILLPLVPYKSISYYEAYLSDIDQIRQWPAHKMATLRIILILVMLLKRLSDNLVNFWHTPRPIRTLVLSYDCVYLSTQQASFNLIWAAFSFTSAAFNYMLYFKSDHKTITMLKDILIQQKSDLFLQERIKGDQSIYQYIGRLSVRLLNCVQVFIVIARKFISVD